MATEPLSDPPEEIEAPSAAQRRMRAEAIQRLQVGLSGLIAMLLLVSLASIVINRANESEHSAVPDTAASASPEPEAKSKDPLGDAGVVPQLPSQPLVHDSGAADVNAPPTDAP